MSKKLIFILVYIIFFPAANLHAEESNWQRVVTEQLILSPDPTEWIESTLRISPDGKRIAYVKNVEGMKCIVVDGKEGMPYDNIALGKNLFSPDGKRFAYAALRGEKRFVVVDGEEQKHYDAIGKAGPVFSPDGKHLTYAARDGKQWYVVVDGVEGKPYDGIADSLSMPI